MRVQQRFLLWNPGICVLLQLCGEFGGNALDLDLCFPGWPDDNLVLERGCLDKLRGQRKEMIGNGQTQNRQAGFTLLEVMITGVVLTVGLLAVAVLFGTAVGNNGRSRVDSTATMLSSSV